MSESNFALSIRWKEMLSLKDLSFPGVYALAVSSTNISGTTFDWIKKIIYFGMTNSAGGLKARLRQFDNTIKGKEGHGGGKRVRFKYRNYDRLAKKLFVSVCPVRCNIKSKQPDDLIKMGEVAYLEYYCFAKYVELFGRLPKFNDKKNAPKLKTGELTTGNSGKKSV